MTPSSDLPQRIVELETRLAFQEHSLQELNDIVTRQQAQIERLARSLKELKDSVNASPVGDRRDEPPPPHY